MPSGRWMDSTLITSAPNAASRWVAAGPAQNAVRSITRTPSSGKPADATSGPDSRGGQGGSSLASPSAGAPRSGAGWQRDISHGGRGWSNPAGLGTNTPRSVAYAMSRMVAPVPTGAIGTRNSAPSSTISSTLRCANQSPIRARMRSRCSQRPSWKLSCGSSASSGQSTIAAKSSHCCPVTMVIPT
ncbi:hypothetical protein C1Y40_02124 [Mycobacterium talmoniae]|uniref:Uncharacterized protein n=1 Tax=Mycobacterium talmoniae TaxID=1858794 RepID=A0A2S8BLU7_9MYCO|nr:hypothetical protein C1Y40_02124 [Mycobacterium talmoniae]